jgi:serine protease AprX
VAAVPALATTNASAATGSASSSLSGNLGGINVNLGGTAAGTPGGKDKKADVIGTIWGALTGDDTAVVSGSYRADKDAGSLFNVTNTIGARSVWQQLDPSGHAITGKGVTVAVLDSGVQAVSGLNGTNKLVQGPDLSLESGSTGLATDTFGHGTHMASIIAGEDPVLTNPLTGAPLTLDANKQLGVAPDAQLLALKLASTDGSTDVSQVIAGLDWVVQHQHDAGMDVRVVNLSFGTNSVQPYQVDPLAAAAENAWKHGIVVVVSGGNAGADAGSLTDPAIDPYVIAVGAADGGGTVSGWNKATAATFSSVGTADRHVDLLAPGRSIVGFRDPGSFVDVNNPSGLVAGDASGRLFRGSGTSQAAAVVSGSVALLLQAYPNLTPDQVKAALVSTATLTKGDTAIESGAGEINVQAAINALRKPATAKTILASKQTFAPATGLGTLDGSRGDNHLVDPLSGVVLSGETDVQGLPWNSRAWAAASAAGTAWNGGTWMGEQFTGDSWASAGSWSRARWSGEGWSRARWSDADWARARWSDAAWERARWSDASWA